MLRSERLLDELDDGIDDVGGRERIEPLADVEGVFMEELEGGEYGEGDGSGCARVAEALPPVPLGRNKHEPELEDVGEEDERFARGPGFEGHEPDEPIEVERERDLSWHAAPAPGHDEEGQLVDLVQPLIEGLVVADAAEVEIGAKEEVAEVDEDGDDGSGEGPAKHGEAAGDADGSDDELFERHGAHPSAPGGGAPLRLGVMTPLELADLQARTDFVHDEGGRLVCVNDIGRPPAPWALVIRTTAGAIARVRAGVPEELARDVEAFARRLSPLAPGADGPDGALEELAELAARHVPVSRRWAGPAFTFPVPLFPAVGAVQLYPGNAVLLHPELATWGPELAARRPSFGVFRDGQVIALCASSRTSAGAAEAGVETVPSFRGQGAACLAVMAWAAAVRGAGKVPIYSTSWENTASRAVARKLELELFAEDLFVG